MKPDIIRKCKHHGMTTYKWYRHAGATGGYCYGCKACRLKWTIDRQERHKKALIEYKGGQCLICGYNGCYDALDFHHPDPRQKDLIMGKSNLTKSLDKLKKEADKCILVCTRCHREIHAGLHLEYLVNANEQ